MMINLKKVEKKLNYYGLTCLGFFKVLESDTILSGFHSIVLVGPKEPVFWSKFSSSLEYLSRLKNPLDLWSERVLNKLAKKIGGKAFFPFQKKPVLPFYDWALRTGQIWESPVKLLVHRKSGLFVSFRGAIAFRKSN